MCVWKHSALRWVGCVVCGCNYWCHSHDRWYKPANAYINNFYYKELVEVPGCTSISACNFNPDATQDDGSCDTISCVQDNSPSKMKVGPRQVSEGEFWGGLIAAVTLLVVIVGVALVIVLRSRGKRRLEFSESVEEGPLDEPSIGLVLRATKYS